MKVGALKVARVSMDGAPTAMAMVESFTATTIGVYMRKVQVDRYDGYFGSGLGISASNIVDRGGRAQSLAVNLGTTPIVPGDLVAMVGIGTNPENGEPLLGVAKVDIENRTAGDSGLHAKRSWPKPLR